MIRAVLDTNVLAAAAVGISLLTSIPGQVFRSWVSGRYDLVVSQPILRELARTLAKPYFQARLLPGQASRLDTLLRTKAVLVNATTPVAGVAAHRADDLVLATAVDGRATYLVTGDYGLLGIGSYVGVHILTPRAFLGVLAAREQESESG